MKLWKSLDSKFWTWFVWMLTGTPERLIQCSSSAVAVIPAVWSGKGTASYHFVKWLPHDAIFKLPFESGNRPWKSIPMWAKGKLGGHLTWLYLCLFGGCYVADKQDNLRQTHTYFLCPGQKNLVRSFSRVCVCPRWANVVELWIDPKIPGDNVVGTTCCKWLRPVLESSKHRHRLTFTNLRESKLFRKIQVSLYWPWKAEQWSFFPFLTKERTVLRLWSSSYAFCM